MKSRTLGIIIGITFTALVIGCAQAPEQQMHHAKNALEAARKAGAEQYALSALKAAEISYGLAMKQVSEENRKLPFMRKYNKISETLASAQRAAESAQAEVEKVKSRLQNESKDMIGTAQQMVDSVQGIMKISGKKKSADSLQGSLDTVQIFLKNASDALNSENFLLAREKSSLAQEKIKTLLVQAEKLTSIKKLRSRSRSR